MVYFISVPSDFFGKSVNVPFHEFPLFSVNVFPGTSVPFANSCTVIDVGLLPSWLFESSHTFSTGISIISGVPVNSIVVGIFSLFISTIGCSPFSVILPSFSVPDNHNVFVVCVDCVVILIFTVVARFLATFI